MQKKKIIAEWLSDDNYMDQQQHNISQYQEGTCKWLLSHPEFCDWEQGTSHTLLCVGIPGAGKTVLSAMVIRHLTQFCQATGGKNAVVFLYFSYDQRQTDSWAKLIGRLSRQLVTQSVEVPSAVESVFQFLRDAKPVDEQYEEMLLSMVECFSRVYFVVDALDEGDELHMKVVSTIISLPKNKVKLFATSRPNLEIESRFRHGLRIEVSATVTDIEKYATSRFNQFPSRVSGNSELREQVIRAIVASTQGMFLLAKLNMDSLEARKRKVSVLRDTLQKLPSGSGNIDKAYDQAMVRIFDQPEDDRSLAQQVLTWIMYAMRPLSKTDLETALAIELGEWSLDPDNIVPFDELSSLCAGLVTVDEAKNVRLVHYTTQEYLSRNPNRLLRNPHRVLSNTCVAYLGLEEFMGGEYLDSEQEYQWDLEARKCFGSHVHIMPFLDYAANNWEEHNKSALTSDDSRDAEQTMSLQLRLLGQEKLMTSYLRALGDWRTGMGPNFDPHTPTGYITFFSFERKTGLQYAASRGGSQHVSALLKLGHDKDEATNGTTPLIEASRSLHEPVVKILLDAKANVHAKDCDGHNAMTAVLLPSKRSSKILLDRGHPNHPPEQARESIVALLLASESDPNHIMDSSSGKTILMYAAQNGRKSIVVMLCDAGADVHARDKNGATALHHAAECGHWEVVRELLTNGCDPDVVDSQNVSPVISAAVTCHWGIVDSLVNTANVDLSRRTEAGDTVLTIACQSTDCPDLVIGRMIEQYHCAVDARGAGDRTPLMVATHARKTNVMKTLLNAGADLLLTDKDDNTALQIAAALPNTCGEVAAILRILLEAGVDIDIRGSNRTTALMLVAEAGSCGSVHFLLDEGANVHLEDQRGWTALTYAAWGGNDAAVSTLLSTATISNRDLALAQAVRRGHVKIVHILARAGVHLNAATQDGTTALISAAENGQVDVARTLIEAGADVDACRVGGKTPLMLAAFRGFKEMTKLLLNAGADINRACDHGETALICLVKNDVEKPLQHRWEGKGEAWAVAAEEIMRMLVEAGADVNRSTENGDTALLLTIQLHRDCFGPVSYTYEKLTIQLLEAGADPVNLERSRQTALISQEARPNLNISAVRLLLEAGADPTLRVFEPYVYNLYYYPCEPSQQEADDIISRLRLQLHYGANVDAVDKQGETTLIQAVRRMRWDVARFLLRAGANPSHEDSMGETALSWLVRHRYKSAWEFKALEEIITTLIAAEANLDAVYDNNNTLILRAAQSPVGSHAVKFLLAAGADPHVSDAQGRNAVMLASMLQDDLQASLTMKLFLDAGVGPNAYDCHGNSALMLTAYRGIEEGDSAPASEKSIEMTLQTLLSAGADANDSDPKGKTVLMAVASRKVGCEAEIRLLVDAGANIDATDEEGRTALAYCIYHGSCENIAPLLAEGANANPADHEGRSPLTELRYHVPVRRISDTVQRLIRAGADVNFRDARGRDALMSFLDGMDCASHPEEIKAVKILFGAGVDLEHVDENGDVALRYAERKGNLGMALLIKREIQSRMTGS